MTVAIHNVRPDNNNRADRIAEMNSKIDAMQKTVNALAQPGAIEALVQKALRPITAELALREKELKERDASQINNQRQRGAVKYLLPKGD